MKNWALTLRTVTTNRTAVQLTDTPHSGASSPKKMMSGHQPQPGAEALSNALRRAGLDPYADPYAALAAGAARAAAPGAQTDEDVACALLSGLALAPAVSRAEAELRRALRAVGGWAAAPCASDADAEAELRALLASQRELLAWADGARRAAARAWLCGPIRARAARLRWQLRKYAWPQCAACTAGACAPHAAALEARLPPLPAPMRALGADEVGGALAFWHARSCGPLDLAGCLEAAAVLAAAEDWAAPLRGPAAAAAAARLAAAAGPTAEALGCALHNRLFPACATPWARCARHRARWQLPPPAPIPPAPAEGGGAAGEAGRAGMAGGGRAGRGRGGRQGRAAVAYAPPPLPPLHGCAPPGAPSGLDTMMLT